MACLALLANIVLSSCSSSAEKVEQAQEKVAAANQSLDKANADYVAAVEKYRRETAAIIATNNESIAAFNARIESEKMEARADYQKKIATLEQKNTDLKKRLDDYKAEGKNSWEQFKIEFSRDLDELGNAFRDLTVKNVK